MSDMTSTPIVANPSVTPEANAANVAQTPPVAPTASPAPEASPSPAQEKPSLASDLKEIQNLLVCGIFPGQMAPSVVKAYSLLQKMVEAIEKKSA